MRRLVFHSVVVVHHLYCAFFFHNVDFSNVVDKTILSMNSVRGSFLTGWNFALQAVYFVACLMEDFTRLYQTNKPTELQRQAKAMKSMIFTALVFPLSCYVCSMFWVFFTYDREMVYPIAIDAKLPLWFNHSLHTTIVVVALAEMCLAYHPYPNRRKSLLYLNGLLLGYAICVIATHLATGVWVYPMLATMGWPMRGVLTVIQHLVCWLFYTVGQRMSSSIWDYQAGPVTNGTQKTK